MLVSQILAQRRVSVVPVIRFAKVSELPNSKISGYYNGYCSSAIYSGAKAALFFLILLGLLGEGHDGTDVKDGRLARRPTSALGCQIASPP
jgi:hypothetical protein